MNCYDLSLDLLRVAAEIDSVLEKKSKTNMKSERDRLDREVDRLEVQMFDIKNILKGIDAHSHIK